MRRLFVLLTFALWSTGAASPASAQSDFAQRYVACISQSRPKLVRELLQSASAHAANSSYRALLDDQRCLGRVFGGNQFPADDASFSIDMLRGQLAGQLLIAEGDGVAALQPLPLQQKRYIRPWFAATGRNPAVDEMAVCMADTDPASVMGLMRTQHGSSVEQARMGTLRASLARCLRAGLHLDANRAALRAALADALYQRVYAQPRAVAGSRR